MRTLTKLPLVVLSATLLTWSVAAADEFQLYGYKQGMTLEQAKQIAVSQKQRLEQLQLANAPNRVAYGVFGSADDANELATLSFCHDHLNGANYALGGGLRIFISLVENYKARNGYKVLHMDTDRFIGDDGILHYQLTAYLTREMDSFHLEIILTDSELANATETRIVFAESDSGCK
jgi:hypothetical protein